VLHAFLYFFDFNNFLIAHFPKNIDCRKFQIFFGHTSFQSVTTKVDYSLQESFTRFGVFSIKV
jgi:hypothetical protein